MLNDHTTIRSTAVFDLVGPPNPPVPVQVEMRYDTRDPYAVQAAFRTGRAGWVEWVFSRDLLTEGLITAAGAGDVRIRPAEHDSEAMEIELSSPSGHATFRAREPRGVGVPDPHPRDRRSGCGGRLARPGARSRAAALQRPELGEPPPREESGGARCSTVLHVGQRRVARSKPAGHMRT